MGKKSKTWKRSALYYFIFFVCCVKHYCYVALVLTCLFVTLKYNRSLSCGTRDFMMRYVLRWGWYACLFVIGVILLAVAVLELLPYRLFTQPYELPATSLHSRTSYSYKTWMDHVSHMNTFVTHDDYRMAYLDKGPKTWEVILLLHGTPTNSWIFRKLITGLTQSEYRVVVPDMIGYGASEKPQGRDPYLLYKQKERIVGLMNYLWISSWHHGFHDMAGVWTRMIAKENPTVIRTLLLFNTIAEVDGFYPPMKKQWDSFFMQIVTWWRGGKTTKLLAIVWFVVESMNDYWAAMEGYVVPFMMGADTAFYQFLTSFDETYHSLALTEWALTSLDVPVFVAWGMNDSILNGEQQIDILSQAMPMDDEYVLLFDDSSHLIMEDYPQEIVKNLLLFLLHH